VVLETVVVTTVVLVAGLGVVVVAGAVVVVPVEVVGGGSCDAAVVPAAWLDPPHAATVSATRAKAVAAHSFIRCISGTRA
jgi:hypothetical protein